MISPMSINKGVVRLKGEFQEVFPVPAESYHLYPARGENREPRHLIASVYACLQCGHLERFVSFDEDQPPTAGTFE